MPVADVVIRGAREHNLRSVNVTLPRNKLICLTGVSGSGKSSLAFDTVYAEGQRRYVESLSSYARQVLGQMPKPDVDSIEGLSPSISISQKSSGQNPRSTVGTITEIYDYLRILYARTGRGHCPKCGQPISAQSREQILAAISELPTGSRFHVLAPIIRGQKGEYRDLFEDLLKQGFARARVDGTVMRLGADIALDRQMRHDIEVVVDRLTMNSRTRPRLAEAVELALRVGRGNLIVAPESDASEAPAKGRRKRGRAHPDDLTLSSDYACTPCGLSFDPATPQLFSFNSPQGMCYECDGLGEVYTFDPERLITRPDLSFRQGCIELIGSWQKLGRWRRHIYKGVAETMDRKLGLAEGTLADTPWQSLDAEQQKLWLWGTGDEHITFTWRDGPRGTKHGGHFEGLIPGLIEKYRDCSSKPLLAQLEKAMRVLPCPDCRGKRLTARACAITLTTRHERFTQAAEMSLPDVCHLSVSEAADFFSELDQTSTEAKIAQEALKEIRGRLGFLKNVGLEYLTLDRTAPTLSGGESQRIRLAGQIGCGLVGVLYILDEPSIGLHPRDNRRLIETLQQLRDQGNTVVVVEHDEETMRSADHLIDFGPGAGVRGGELVAAGSVAAVAREPRSVTGQFLAGKQKIEVPTDRRTPGKQALRVIGARHNNLCDIDARIPLGNFVCVTGPSGSGKSSLVNGILVEALCRDLNGGKGSPGEHRAIEGLEHLDKLIAIDQSPIGRTPRSNPATYIKLLDEIRRLFCQIPEAKRRGYKPGRFSFNVNGGRCEACEGNGSNRIEMDFLADVWVTCAICGGARFNRETLQVRYKGASIADVLDMDVQQAIEHFENIPAVHHRLQTLHSVGLDYLKLGQPSPTLSGGEAQRIKLARELVKKSTGRTLYLLDEPTTGLHFADIRLLLKVLHDFVDAGNTVLVVEHNLDVVKTADWVIDLGPEGGDRGGNIVAQGTPEAIARHAGRAKRTGSKAATEQLNGAILRSYTGEALAPLLNGKSKPGPRRKPPAQKRRKEIHTLRVEGARQHNLKGIDVSIPREQWTVCCGPSGSGKSSLAFDTIYAEGQRRYVESLSAYARQFVGQMQKPLLEHVEGLSPAIAIEQKNLGHTPRSTVGTVTDIYDYLRILFARLGQPFCPDCDIPVGTQSSDEIIEKVMAEETGTRLLLMAPVLLQSGERYETLWDEMRAAGYLRVRVDGVTHTLDDVPSIDRRRKHHVEIVVDRVVVQAKNRSRIAESIEGALSVGEGVLRVAYPRDDVDESRWQVKTHSQHFVCEHCERSFVPLSPHNFSFNSPLGWCEACEGLGTQTGANPAALIRDSQLTLEQGAVLLWPGVKQPLFRAMLAALSEQTGLPLDVPYERLNLRQRRLVLFGTGDDWIEVLLPAKQRAGRTRLRFQYKGLYPALDEASRLTPAFRSRLEHLVDEIECSTCGGSRLRDDAASVQFRRATLGDISRLPLAELLADCKSWKLSARDRKIAGELIREIVTRLEFLVDVGLDYLTLGRGAPTLSGGEAQRIRLASQVGNGLCGVLYVLDEPTIGLHPRDNARLIRALQRLRDLGNTLLVVEHDREVIQAADQVLDFGPRAGRHGGQIVAQGTPAELSSKRASVTGPYLTNKKAIAVPRQRRLGSRRSTDKAKATAQLEIIGARHHNLKNLDVAIPLGCLTVVTGVSGSGKSSLVEGVLAAQLQRTLHRASTSPGPHQELRGVEEINKVIQVTQKPLGNSPASNPATYTGVFELIRSLFSQLPDAKLRGYGPRRFSFNVAGGRCDACEGEGQLCIEMHFLPDVWVECDTCHGKRYNPETLEVRYRGHSIAEVLELSCGDAASLFDNIPKIHRILQTLCDVGLDYLTLGQPAPTLSGGEAQRVKLAAELARPDTGRTLYLLDEPTTGLHFDDLVKLLEVLQRLVDVGNTVVVIEHNLDMIKSADWLIELGPEAGAAGGELVTYGTPEDVVDVATQQRCWDENGREADPGKQGRRGRQKKPILRSHTGEALAPVLAASPRKDRTRYDPHAARPARADDLEIAEVGRDTKMPWETDGRRWHTRNVVGRNGQPVQWDGRILERIVDRIHELGEFSPTQWNHRSIVEIAAPRKADGWFLHAITAENWLLKLKFRVRNRTFDRQRLMDELALRPLNELDHLPAYGTDRRVKCKNLRGPWQEIQMQPHSLDEIDRPEFWHFLERAVASFLEQTERAATRPEDVMPWKVLGRNWHLSRKGFPPGKRIHWETTLLERVCKLLVDTAGGGEFEWTNQQIVHFRGPDQEQPWASLHTKRPQNLEVVLMGPKDQYGLGRVANLGTEPQLQTNHKDRDVLRLRFSELAHVRDQELKRFLAEHWGSVTSCAT